jgi:hypothetical protein
MRSRVLTGAAGALLVVGAVTLISHPQSTHMGRGLYFALILGAILLCTAAWPS